MKDSVNIAHNEYHNSLFDVTQEMIDNRYEEFLCELSKGDNDKEDIIIDTVVQYNDHINDILLARDDEEILKYVKKFRDMIKTNVVGEL